MFEWLFSTKKVKKLEEETKRSFSDVKRDMDVIGKWIKHLDKQDKQLFDVVYSFRNELSSVQEEIESLREGINVMDMGLKNKQVLKVFKKLFKQLFKQAIFMIF